RVHIGSGVGIRIGVGFHYPANATQRAVLVNVDQGDPLGCPAHFTDFVYPGTHQHTAACDQHDLVRGRHQDRTDQITVACSSLVGNQAFGAMVGAGIFRDECTVSVAAFGGSQDTEAVIPGNQHANDRLVVSQPHAPHSARCTPHGPDVGLIKTHGLAVVG